MMWGTVMKLNKIFKRYGRDCSGQFAIMFALSSLFLLAGGIFVIDFNKTLNAKTELRASADAAMLAGLHAIENSDLTKDNEKIKLATATADSVFKSQLGGAYAGATLKTKFKIHKGVVSGVGKYNFENPSAFSSGFGQMLEINDEVSVTYSAQEYLDIVFLIDISASMGIGATKADQNLMYSGMYDSGSSSGCAFACHTPKNDYEAQFSPAKARGLGAQLKIDVVREAALDALSNLEGRVLPGVARVSVYTFDNNLYELVAPTTDIDAVMTELDNLDVAQYDASRANEYGGTYIRQAMVDLETRFSPGAGTSPADRKAFLIFFSDGMENATWHSQNAYFSDGSPQFKVNGTKLTGWVDSSINYDGFMQVFDHKACNILKRDGFEIYSVQSVYETSSNMDDKSWNVPKVDFVESQQFIFKTAFEKCASRVDTSFVVDSSTDMNKAFNNIVGDIVQYETLRVSQ